jgi:SsrA-binding protein
MARKKDAPGELLVCRNPKATKEYEIEERFEAGLVLTGSEVKSLRDRKADLEGAYASVQRGELWLHKMHIAPYEQAGAFGHEPKRSRKLLLRAPQINRIHGSLTTKGRTLVPLAVYFKNGWAKVEVGLGKGKRTVDKRQDLKRKADMREARAVVDKGRR